MGLGPNTLSLRNFKIAVEMGFGSRPRIRKSQADLTRAFKFSTL